MVYKLRKAHYRSHLSGFALFQVLLVAAFCSLLLLSFSAYTKKQLRAATIVSERIDALIALQNVQTLIELKLLTNEDPNNAFPDWNIYSKPFFYGNVEIIIQDLSGLYSITPFGTSRLLMLFRHFVPDESQANAMAKNLEIWQSKAEHFGSNVKSRHAPLQTLQELKFIPGFTEPVTKKIRPFVTLYPTPYFSPMSAPVDLLEVFLNDGARAREINALRESNKLTQDIFWRLTSIEPSDTISYSFGPGYRIILIYRGESVRYKRLVEATFSPYDKKPLRFWLKNRVVSDS